MAARAGKLKVIFASSEVAPFSKTGGLADVSGSLPVALRRLGAEVRVITPKYASVALHAYEAALRGEVPVHFIEHGGYFMRADLYGGKGGDYPDNLERFAFFSRRVLEASKEIGVKPDVIHCNDWQTALVPVYLKTLFKGEPFYRDTKTILTVHNIGYQGIFPKEEFPKTALGWEVFNIDGLEFYDQVNLLKGGLMFSDAVTTVSPTYASEIQTKEFGYGLDGVLRKRKDSLFGIINGVDYEEWDPAKDEELEANFSAAKIDGKYKCKAALQREAGLKASIATPLIGMVSRLADQKGLDLVAAIMERLLKLDAQFIILGTGEDRYHAFFERMRARYSGRVSANLKFDAMLAKKIYAGCNIFLMPSSYEPCGLGQLISLRYGTIPVVRKTGGLADTITEYDPCAGRGNGYLFERYDAGELFAAINRALSAYRDADAWKRLVVRAMECDFSWESSAAKYIELYRKLQGKR